jgi:anti-sigma-K factor RskA
MTTESTMARDEADPLVTALLREAYAAPEDGEYWSALTRSVVARAQTARHGAMALGMAPRVAPWWSGFGEWRQAGMVAAAAALMAYAYTVMGTGSAMPTPAAVVAASRVLDGAGTADSGHADLTGTVSFLSSAP